MNDFLNTITQTINYANEEVLRILIGFSIIGMATVWYFRKSKLKKNIASLESEMLYYKEYTLHLNEDLDRMIEIIKAREMDIDGLSFKLDVLRDLKDEAIQETDEMRLKNEKIKERLVEKNKALVHILERKQLLDYKSFGTATYENKDDLKMISGIGNYVEERLHALNIYTFRQISKFTENDIDTINNAMGYFIDRIDRDQWIIQAKEMVDSQDKRDELFNRIAERKKVFPFSSIGTDDVGNADDLTLITGIGGYTKEKLNALGIYTFLQISRLSENNVELLSKYIEYFPGRIERDEWVLQANDLVRIAGHKADLLIRIAARKDKFYIDSLGISHKNLANNLTQINGISPWIEERLNMLEIYTFEQVSRLTSVDITTIAEILEFSPERIIKDNWVNQACEKTRVRITI